MADPALTPATFDGTNINSGGYISKFLAAHDVASTPDVEPIEVETPGDFAYPTSARSQPQSRVFPLYVKTAWTQAAIYAFKKLFDPDKGDVLLTVTDGDATTWRMTVRVTGAPQFAHQPDLWIVRLYAARPIWESDTEHSDAETINSTPHLWNPTPAPVGTKCLYPTIEVKPTVAKADTDDYTRRWEVVIAWRSPLPGVDSQGLGYPTDVNDGNIDLSVEFDNARLQADGDDLRVLVDGVEVDRWIDDTLVADYVWCNISFRPMRKVMLRTAMASAISPAAGEWMDLWEHLPTTGWDNEGFLLVASECIQYDAIETGRIRVKVRGARGTTAAGHAANQTLYWVEHDIQIVSDYSAAADPPESTDRQPVIDLAASSNAAHKYAGTIFAGSALLRSGQLLRRYTNDNLLSATISLKEEGGGIKFRDVAPSAAAPRFNGLELYTPCLVGATAADITHDVTVEDILSLEVYGTDLEGYESLLERYNSGNDGAAETLQPASVLSRLTWRANSTVITGADVGDVGNSELQTSPSAQSFTLDAQSEVWGLILRFKKEGSPTDDIEVYLAEDDEGVPGDQIAATWTLDSSTLTTSYALYSFRVSALGGAEYLVLPASTYWIVVRRVGTTGAIYWAHSSVQVYGKGTFFIGGGSSPAGPNSPGTLATIADGQVDWTNIANAAASDNSYATCALGPGEASHGAKATNFSFAVPTDAIITGILVEAEAKCSDAITNIDGAIRIIKAGAEGSVDRKRGGAYKWPAADTYIEWGGATDMWGETWTPAQINAADFGCSVRSWAFFLGGGSVTASIDHIRISVFFTVQAEAFKQTATFYVNGRPQSTLQAEAPSGTTDEIVLDDIIITFSTSYTPTVVHGAQENIYWLKGTLKNDDTGQKVELSVVVPLNTTITIDCLNHTVTRDDTGESIPGAITPSDLEEWMRWGPAAVNMRWTETGIGTVVVTPKYRDAWR